MKKFRLILVPLLLLTLIFNTAVVFAGDDDGIEPYELDVLMVSFNRINMSQSLAEVTASLSGTVEYVTTTITLQQAEPGSNKYSDVSGSTSTKTSHSDTHYHTKLYNTGTSKDYRIKVTISAKCNISSNNSTVYKELS